MSSIGDCAPNPPAVAAAGALICARYFVGDQALFETSGYVQDWLRTLNLCPRNDRVLLCGNPDMIETCTNRLEARGFDRKSIKREKYIAGPPPR